ncbi:hypothetical protein NUW58_g10085 [Xylaria curta]|uniref:Uncharacterized protein n=1 Tax=Xylaria curta TaxID=42375 RepID=A0ACC1MPU9_9PEZI|nr:hypothetical protein NUW58_g10085 [Xylaria curta]
MSMLMLDWNHKLKEDGVKIFSVSPGFCATGLGNLGADAMKAMGAEHPSEGGRRLLSVAEGNRDADAGKILDKPVKGLEQLWEKSQPGVLLAAPGFFLAGFLLASFFVASLTPGPV